MTDSKTFTVAFFCKTGSSGKQELMHCMFTVLQGPRLVRNLFGTCSGFVRFHAFWQFLQLDLVGTCSELVRVLFGFRSGVVGPVQDVFFSVPTSMNFQMSLF